VLDPIDAQRHHSDARVTQSIVRRTVVGARVQDDEVRAGTEYGFDAGPKRVPERWDERGGVRVEVPFGASDDARARVHREQEVGRRRIHRHEASRHVRQPRQLSAEVVALDGGSGVAAGA
jgi:hypothetical protein